MDLAPDHIPANAPGDSNDSNDPRDTRVAVVHITAYYPSAAREASFPARLQQTLQQVVTTAYSKLEEHARPGDMIFCHHDEPRTDLSPYLGQTLAQMAQQGICVQQRHDHQHELAIDLDAEAGGA